MFNPDTHFLARNVTQKPLTLKAADGSYVMLHPGSGLVAIEHKFNWDMPDHRSVSFHAHQHPEMSVRTADHRPATTSTNVGSSAAHGQAVAAPTLSINQRVQKTLDLMNYNRLNKIPPKFSNKNGKVYQPAVSKAAAHAAKQRAAASSDTVAPQEGE